jgi:hypothetical protein
LTTDNTATVTIDVYNNAPYAYDASFSVLHDRELTGQLYGYDPDGDPITAQLVSGPSNGTLSFNPDGTFTYTPNTHYVGPDSFTYTWSDGLTTGNTATVSIDVYNNAPYAYDARFSVLHDRELGGQLEGYDLEEDPLVARLVEGPNHGTIYVSPEGTFVYKPNPAYVGQDSFVYQWFDGIDYSEEITVQISVVNTPPVARDAMFDVSPVEPVVLALIAPVVDWADQYSAYDPDGDQLIIEVEGQPQHGRITNYGTYLVYVPQTGTEIWLGSDSFTYRVWDGLAYSETRTVWLHRMSETVNVNAEQLEVKIWAHYPVHKHFKWQEPSLVNFANFNLDGVAYIRANGDDDDGDGIMDSKDKDVPNENDLLMVTLDFGTHTMPANIEYRIKRDNNSNLWLWSVGPRKGPFEIFFNQETGDIEVRNPPILDDKTKERVLPFPTGKRILNLWAEWPTRPDFTFCDESVLTFEAFDTVNKVVVSSSRVRLKPFTGLVIVFGGMDQQPQDFHNPDRKPNLGTYDIAEKLFRAGYDVLTYEPNAQAAADYEEVLKELRKAIGDSGARHLRVTGRGQNNIALIGYSRGGGAVYDVSALLQEVGRSLEKFTVRYTGYIDAIRMGWFAKSAEIRRPRLSLQHVNFYQLSGLIHGNETKDKLDSDHNEEVKEVNHYTIDDSDYVKSQIIDKLRNQGWR